MKINQAMDPKGTQTNYITGQAPGSAAALEAGNPLAEKEKSKEREQVTVEISDEMKDMWQQELEAQKESAKAQGKAMEDLGKIMEIARRISKGDRVPAKDERRLMEYSNELYQAAKMSAALSQSRKHKKHKSLFEEEEDKEMRDKLRALENESASESAEPAAEPAGESADTGETGGKAAPEA